MQVREGRCGLALQGLPRGGVYEVARQVPGKGEGDPVAGRYDGGLPIFRWAGAVPSAGVRKVGEEKEVDVRILLSHGSKMGRATQVSRDVSLLRHNKGSSLFWG